MNWLARWLARSSRDVVREEHVVCGIRVFVENTRPDIATATALERLEDALALLARTQPWRFRHLQQDIAAIFVVRHPTRGAYLPDPRMVLTELTFLARRDIPASVVASSILHEGVHARVHRMVKPDTARHQAHEERICRRAELSFGRALPAEIGRPVVERANESLALGDTEVAPEIDWELAIARQRDVDREVMRRVGDSTGSGSG